VGHAVPIYICMWRGASSSRERSSESMLSPGAKCSLAFTRYSFGSRPLCTNQSYSLQTPLLFRHPTPPTSSPTLLRNRLFPPDPPLLQYTPYNIGNGSIVKRPICSPASSKPHVGHMRFLYMYTYMYIYVHIYIGSTRCIYVYI